MIGSGTGSVVATRGALVEARIAQAHLGCGMRITTRGGRSIAARVTAVDQGSVMLAPLAGLEGIAAGDRVAADEAAVHAVLGTACLGRAVDGRGAALDGAGPLAGILGAVDSRRAISPGERAPVLSPFATGIPVLDGPLAFGCGARIGIFGAPGCGKSTLLETIAAGSSADATVVGLVGERGREAERWLSRIDRRTIVVCATSDRSAAERLSAAQVAFAQADALRRRGLHVLLVLDSLARTAAAAREIALSIGEPVGRGGYPPSVFALLAGLVERAGAFASGSITLVATVLSDGPDEHDPVSEACRAALDGHIVLTPRLARQGWFPAIDVPASASRTLCAVVSPAHRDASLRFREAVAILDETREARGFGLDPGLGDAAVRRAIENEGALAAFARRPGPVDLPTTLTEFMSLTDRL